MKRKQAFTFIELIIAVTIFSIIAVSIYSTIRAGTRVWQRANSIIEVNQGMRIFFDTISSDLKNTLAYYSTTGEGRTNFEGRPQRISFMTLVDVSSQGQSLHQELAGVVYEFGGGKIKRALATKEAGFNENDPNKKEVVLIDNVDDFKFEYCYKETSFGDEYTYKWNDAWQDASKIPRAVKIKVGEFKKTIFIPAGELVTEE